MFVTLFNQSEHGILMSSQPHSTPLHPAHPCAPLRTPKHPALSAPIILLPSTKCFNFNCKMNLVPFPAFPAYYELSHSPSVYEFPEFLPLALNGNPYNTPTSTSPTTQLPCLSPFSQLYQILPPAFNADSHKTSTASRTPLFTLNNVDVANNTNLIHPKNLKK